MYKNRLSSPQEPSDTDPKVKTHTNKRLYTLALALVLLASIAVGATSEAALAQGNDYFHKGLGHGTGVPDWAKNANVYFLPPPGKGAGSEIAASESGGGGLTKGSLLTYFGGGVQRTPHPHLIFWGSNWSKSGEPQEIREALILLFSGLSGSGYQGIMTQYFANPNSEKERHPLPISKTVTFSSQSDVYIDSTVAAPAEVSRTAAVSEIGKARTAKGWSASFDDQYFVIPAPGSTYQSGFLGSFCAFHAFQEVAYSFVTYPGTVPGCGMGPKSVSRNASHEYAETVTDPVPYAGWNIPVTNEAGELLGQVEIADYCDQQPSLQLENGAWVEPLKDNYRTNQEGGESIHCEGSDPSPPQFSVEGPAVSTGTPGQVTLSGSIDPAGYKTVKYWFERYSAGWVKIAGGGSVGGTAPVSVSQAISGADVAGAERYRLVAQIPTAGYEQGAVGRVYSPTTFSKPAWPGLLCATVEQPCQKANRLAAGTTLLGTASGQPEFELVLANRSSPLRCSEGSWQVQTQAGGNNPLPVSGTGWSLAGCKLNDGFKETSCTVTAGPVPFSGVVVWRGGSEGEVRQGATGEGNVTWRIKCPEASEPIDCTFDRASTNVLKGGTSPELRTRIGTEPAVEAKEHQSGALCPGYMGNAKLNFLITTPKPFYVAPIGKQQPAVTSGYPTQEGETEALLNGVVNPNGFTTTYQFEYVDDARFREDTELSGSGHGFDHASVATAEDIGAGTTPVTLHRSLKGLKPETAYHVRLMATNAEGDSYGREVLLGTVGTPTYKSSFGSSGSGDGQFKYLTDVAVDPADGTLWVTDDDNDRVQHLTAAGGYLGQFKSCYDPGAIAVTPAGALYVACSSLGVIQKYSAKGEALKVLASSGSGEGQVRFPLDLAIDSSGAIWAADTENNRIDKFSGEDKFVKSISLGSNAKPWGIGVSQSGEVWVTEPWEKRVTVVDGEGKLLRRFGSAGSGAGQFAWPSDVELDNRGYAWVGDAVNDRVQIFNEAGEYVTQFGSKGSGPGQFDTDWWLRIAVNGDGEAWVTDSGNARVERWRSAGGWTL
jgi:DNA-binding beta-propeller fold protein YncE